MEITLQNKNPRLLAGIFVIWQDGVNSELFRMDVKIPLNPPLSKGEGFKTPLFGKEGLGEIRSARNSPG
ncbi:MAG: hypothetical protein DRH07_06610 [Deltaproteobacteria bacterium]|nr:MAG: hypothetical protein DRH07_06610 [Deltaproteobacteria bacterium]